MQVEANFIYKKEDKYVGAYLFQIAHLWCWSLLHYDQGIYEIPASNAFASAVNIDRVWRKSATASVATPTNPVTILDGEELSMTEILEKIGY
jgi:hypothetical protein